MDPFAASGPLEVYGVGLLGPSQPPLQPQAQPSPAAFAAASIQAPTPAQPAGDPWPPYLASGGQQPRTPAASAASSTWVSPPAQQAEQWPRSAAYDSHQQKPQQRGQSPRHTASPRAPSFALSSQQPSPRVAQRPLPQVQDPFTASGPLHASQDLEATWSGSLGGLVQPVPQSPAAAQDQPAHDEAASEDSWGGFEDHAAPPGAAPPAQVRLQAARPCSSRMCRAHALPGS